MAARNALVKQLKAEGDRESATMIAAMRRPPWADWALNVVATEDAPVVDRFADAAAAMRDAQQAAFAGRSGIDLRSAINELRERTAELARRANEVLTRHRRPAALAEITERLGEVAADEAASEQLRTGTLVDGGSDSDDVFAAVADEEPRRRSSAAANTATKTATRTATKTPSGTATKAAGTRSAKTPAKAATKDTPRKSEQKKPRAERDTAADRRRAERELDDAERVHRLVARDLGRADSAVRQASNVVDTATEAVAHADANLERAKERLAREKSDREGVQRRMDQAERELERARRSVAELADD